VKNIKDYNLNLAKGEANRDQLTEELATLEHEMTALDKALKEAKEVRDQESAENEQAVKDAQEGQAAITEAIGTLRTYYSSAKDNQVPQEMSLLSKQAPDVDFENEAYTGAQDAAVGVLGMLDVIKSDFVRGEEQAKLDEKTSEAEYAKFKATSDASLISKEKQHESKNFDKQAQEAKITDDTENLRQSQTLLDGIINEMLQLHAACVATGETHAERTAAREEEIAALKDALNILEEQGPR